MSGDQPRQSSKLIPTSHTVIEAQNGRIQISPGGGRVGILVERGGNGVGALLDFQQARAVGDALLRATPAEVTPEMRDAGAGLLQELCVTGTVSWEAVAEAVYIAMVGISGTDCPDD